MPSDLDDATAGSGAAATRGDPRPVPPQSLHALDIAHLVHPLTDARRHERIGPAIVERGFGIHVFDDQGREYIEAMSGLWSVALGFGEARLVEAAARQMRRLAYYPTVAHQSNEPAIRLAEALVRMTPPGLDRVFFANSGSEANDTVVKLVWYYNNALGRPGKKKFIGRHGGYHGTTVASGSLTGLQANQVGFDLPIPFVRHVACPHQYRFGYLGDTEAEFADTLAADLEAAILEEGPDTVAAFIGEAVMGAGGVIVPPAGYWDRVQEICRRYDILLVIDEVITGFGRLGVPFACDHFRIRPDLLVLSKQLTSSYMPLGAVLFSDAVYQAMADQSEHIGGFGHGFTTSGHPVACAVALENLAIIEERGLVAHARAVGAHLQSALRALADHSLVGEVRGLGLLAAVELVADKAWGSPFIPVGSVGNHLVERARAHGLIVRAIGDSIAFCPPLIITAAECDELVARFTRALAETTAWVQAGRPGT